MDDFERHTPIYRIGLHLNRSGFCIIRFAILFIAALAYITPAKACFDDEKLSKLVQSPQPSLIYVWSPRMVLSVTQAHLAAEQARSLGVRFVPVVDGRLAASEWQAALKKVADTEAGKLAVLTGSQALCSQQLLSQDAYLHFPVAFVLQNGQMHALKLVGAMPAGFWRQGLLARLDTGAAASTSSSPAVEQTKPSNTMAAVSPVSVPAVSAASPAQQCIPQNQFFALDPALAGLDDNKEVALGAYERVSPDGRFVLRSYSGKRLTAVSLVELPGPMPGLGRQQMFETPLQNEAFPVQGSWRYVVDVNGDHYAFDSMLRNKNADKPLFKGGMTGFYAAAAEVDSSYPARSSRPIRIRSLSWPNAAGGDNQGEGMLTSRTLTVDPVQNRVVADTGRVNHCLNRLSTDGAMYALPMISVDGQEFATLPQMPVAGVSTMRIFGFGADGQQCEPRAQFKSPSGKVIFGFPSPASPASADVAYEYRSQVWWYERASGTPFNLAPWSDPAQAVSYQNVLASAFPGITRDGRVVYAATWKRCSTVGSAGRCVPEGGYIIADPYQSNAYQNRVLQGSSTGKAVAKACITVQDVLKERAAFAAFHGISN